jgi:hypothetical protein
VNAHGQGARAKSSKHTGGYLLHRVSTNNGTNSGDGLMRPRFPAKLKCKRMRTFVLGQLDCCPPFEAL